MRRDDPRHPRGQVLRLLRDHGPLPRVALAKLTGLSPTSITRITTQLIEDGIVAEGATISPTRLGRPATEVALQADRYFVVGVQIGVGFASIGLIDLRGGLVGAENFTYAKSLPPEDVFQLVATFINGFIESRGRDRVLGVGVGVPGPVDSGGRRMLLPIHLKWSDVAVADILEPLLRLPVTVEHNVRAMALAESRFGLGANAGSVAFVYLRTGLGAGLVVEGQPFSGGVHGALELGHMRTSDKDLPCVCGGTGCLETVVSDRALRASAIDAGVSLSDQSSPLGALFAAAADGNTLADSAIREVIGQLAIGLSAMSNLLNPEVFVLGGTLTSVSDAFIDQLVAETSRAVFPVLRSSLRFENTSLGVHAGVIGGGAVALDRYLYGAATPDHRDRTTTFPSRPAVSA